MTFQFYVKVGLFVTWFGFGSVGCSGPTSESQVREAYLDYRIALSAGDLAGLSTRLTAEKARSLDSPDAAELLGMVRSLAPAAPVPGEVTVTGDRATLALAAEWEGQAITGSVDLLREDGDWKIVEEHWTLEMPLGAGSGDFAQRLLSDRAARPRKQFSWRGHDGAVTRAVFVADGISLATVSYDDYRLCLWDPTSGSLRDELTLEHRPTDMAALPRGGVVVGDATGHLTVVPQDFEGWGEPHRLSGNVGGITHLAVSRDGKRVATSTFQEPLRIWNLETGLVERELGGATSLRGVAFSPAGDLLAAGGHGNTYVTWKIRDGGEFGGRKERTIPKVDEHSDVQTVAISPDGKSLLTGHMDSSITLWDARQGKQIHNVYVPEASTFDVAWCPDGTLFASAQQDGCIYLWDRETATPLAKLKAHDGAALTVTFDPLQWELFASGGEDGQVAIWR